MTDGNLEKNDAIYTTILDELDEYLDQYDGQQAYELVKTAISGLEHTDIGLQYRLAHACYILSNFCVSKEDERCHLLEEAHTACKMAYEIEPKNGDVLKWSAIITGTLAELTSLNDAERVIYVQEFKKFLDEAMAGSPDSSVYHMYGRFHYRMATLSEGEKDHVIAAFGTVPAATVDEALINLHKAEELNPGHIDNLMYLAKCYIAKGEDSVAQKYLMPIVEMMPVDDMDEKEIAEAQQLLAGIMQRNPEIASSLDKDAEEGAEKDDSAENLRVDTDSEETDDTTDTTSTGTEEESDATGSTVSA